MAVQPTSTDLSDAATLVEQSINQIATLRGQLGSIQKNALESNVTARTTFAAFCDAIDWTE